MEARGCNVMGPLEFPSHDRQDGPRSGQTQGLLGRNTDGTLRSMRVIRAGLQRGRLWATMCYFSGFVNTWKIFVTTVISRNKTKLCYFIPSSELVVKLLGTKERRGKQRRNFRGKASREVTTCK